MKTEEEDDSNVSDDIRLEDGRVRYWMFVNGEQYRLFAGITAGVCLVIFCALSVLGLGTHWSGIIAAILCAVGFIAFRLLDRALREYEGRDWRKDKRSPALEKIKIVIAAVLWLLIVVGFGGIMIAQWLRPH